MLKKITFWVSEEELEDLKELAAKRGVSVYRLVKQAALRQKRLYYAPAFIYLLMLYAAGVTGCLLFLLLLLMG